MADAEGLNPSGGNTPCGFESRPGHVEKSPPGEAETPLVTSAPSLFRGHPAGTPGMARNAKAVPHFISGAGNRHWCRRVNDECGEVVRVARQHDRVRLTDRSRSDDRVGRSDRRRAS